MRKQLQVLKIYDDALDELEKKGIYFNDEARARISSEFRPTIYYERYYCEEFDDGTRGINCAGFEQQHRERLKIPTDENIDKGATLQLHLYCREYDTTVRDIRVLAAICRFDDDVSKEITKIARKHNIKIY